MTDDPVPRLPTETWTLICVDWKRSDRKSHGYMLLTPAFWQDIDGTGWVHPQQLSDLIEGFEVLSRPVVGGGIALGSVQRETAKAVLDRVRELTDSVEPELEEVAREFGVES